MQAFAAGAPNCGESEGPEEQSQDLEEAMEGNPSGSSEDSPEPTEYEYFWPNKFNTRGVTTLDELLAEFEWAVNILREMKAAGVTLREGILPEDDDVMLVTTDPEFAKKFGFEEGDYDWLEDEEDEDEEDEVEDAEDVQDEVS